MLMGLSFIGSPGGSRTRRRSSFFFFFVDFECFFWSTFCGAAVLGEGCVAAGWAATIAYVRWLGLLLPDCVGPALSGASFSRSTLLSWWAIFLPCVFASPLRPVIVLSMAAARASDARAAASSSVAFRWASV